MSFVKWMRKNNTKIMAVVVIVLMVAFIGGSSFKLIFRGSGGMNQAVAYYGHKKKINHYDRAQANQEIEILTALRADEVLRAQDLTGILLSELLFSQSRSGGSMLDLAKQTVQRNQYRITDKQLSDLYRNRAAPSDIYWILLREEAEAAGVYIPNKDVGQLLGQIIPRLFDNQSYAAVMQSLVNRFNVPEEQILATFGKMFAVLRYAQTVCSMEDVTAAQAKHIASRESETLNAEFVQIPAAAFADKEQTPSEDAVLEQFNKYKDNFAGDVTEANPFGFGYKLPDRVQLEYIAVKLPDVEAIVKPPTEEEAEQYYQQNRLRLFSEQVPSNPNDPNSPRVERAKSYAEVATTVMDQLKRQKIVTKAEQILQEARNTADAGLQPTSAEARELTREQRAHVAGSYQTIAEELGKKNKVALHYGKTGLLNAMQVQSDKYLSRMFLTGFGYTPVRLSQVLFSVKEFGDDASILLSLPPAEIYASVGPARDAMLASVPDMSGQIMMIARAVDVQKATAPGKPEVAFSTRGVELDNAAETRSPSFSVREEVIKDLQKLAAWDTAKGKAEEFLAAARKDGWDKAVTQFNQVYGAKAKAEPNDPNVFKLDRFSGMQRIHSEDLQVLAAQVANSPVGPLVLNEARVEGRLADQLYARAPADRDAPAAAPQILEFKPSQSFYCLKSLTREYLSREDFQRMKGMILLREEHNQVQSLVAVHLNPENIVKRMNFKFAKQAEPAAEDKAEQKPKGTS